MRLKTNESISLTYDGKFIADENATNMAPP